MRALLLALPALGSLNEKIVYAHRAARDEPPRWFYLCVAFQPCSAIPAILSLTDLACC